MADWFSQLATKFTTSPMAVSLRAADRDNGWRWLDLVSVARDCNMEGALVDTIAGQEIPWCAETLCHRVQCTPAEYQAFLDLCVGRGWLLKHDAPKPTTYVIPNPRYWWGAKTEAERQADKRKRASGSNERNPDDARATESGEVAEESPIATSISSDNVPSLSVGHGGVTPMSRDVTAKSRQSHGVSRDVTPLYTDLQTDPDLKPISIPGTRQTAQAPAHGPSVSLKMDKSIQGQGKPSATFSEPEFLTMVVDLYARYITRDSGPRWGKAPLNKLKASLKKPWAREHPDWGVRIAAIRAGLIHMADDLRAIADGTRAIPIDSPWNFALSLAPDYAPQCQAHADENRRRRDAGEKQIPYTWERVPWNDEKGRKAG